MRRSRANPYLLFRPDENHLAVMVKLQLDDRLLIGSEAFLDDEEKVPKLFLSSPWQPFSKTVAFFIGLEIRLNN